MYISYIIELSGSCTTDLTIEHLLVDSFTAKRAEETEQMSAMLASTSSLVSQELSDIDDAQQLAGQELISNMDQLLNHCSETKVCADDSQLFHVELFGRIAGMQCIHAAYCIMWFVSLQRLLNRPRCHFGAESCGSNEPCIRWGADTLLGGTPEGRR